MCLGIPGQVVDVGDVEGIRMGRVSFGGIVKQVCLAHVADVTPGDWVLVHVGFALSRLDEEEAGRLLELLSELADASEVS
jgi:hydrogenase expression/formation protein HypC